jgi:clan AA aspartic protease (TIGR02281 family)
MFDPDVGGQAQRMLEELNVTDQAVEQRVATIDDFQGAPLIRRGNHFVVEATLNGSERLKLIIDTGASLTIIKPERLRSSINENLDRYPTYKFSTANGIVRAPVLKVSSLAIAEFEVTNMEVGGLALINTEGVDGLLGMNFLKHFRFFIDQQNNVLRLALNQEQ